MHRKDFLKQTSLVAIGVGAFGNLKWKGDHFAGDTPTTTDILGPFYRPGRQTGPPGSGGHGTTARRPAGTWPPAAA